MNKLEIPDICKTLYIDVTHVITSLYTDYDNNNNNDIYI